MDTAVDNGDNHSSQSRAQTNPPPPSDDGPSGTPSSKQNSHSSSGHSKYSNGPHIRSRITVVCAECKRLKLKCDRRTPCSSCLKRDTVQRCIYSQAATEKIDVQSLHNRLLVVEGTLAQLSSASPSTSISNAFANIPPFKSSYPNATPFLQPSTNQSAFAQVASGSFNSSNGNHASGSNTAYNEHSLLALGSSGSAVVFSMEDVSSIWLAELNLTPSQDSDAGRSSLAPFGTQNSRTSSSHGKPSVKLEPSAMVLPPTPPISGPLLAYPSSSPPGPSSIRFPSSPAFIPPLPYTMFIPADLYSYNSSQYLTASPVEVPQVTPALLSHLPQSSLTRTRFMHALADALALHPSVNVQHFKHRIEAMVSWGLSPNPSSSQPFGLESPRPMSKQELARSLFLPDSVNKRDQPSNGSNPSPKPTLSFFAAAAAAFALGALLSRDGKADNGGIRSSTGDSALSYSHSAVGLSPGLAEQQSGKETNSNPAVLLALSEQALEFFEKTSPYDVDSLVAMVLQVLYQLHDGQTRIAQRVFPLVGKMINVARMMGLPIDPDEFPGTFSLFEAETRRRVWWDIFYFDVFLSDCMGHPTLIADHTFNTKLPSDVDEEKFSPSSTSLPLVNAEEQCENSSAYIVLKCRLAQLMKSVKKQTSKESHTDETPELSIDQAASVETEIANWLSDLPSRFRLDMGTDASQSNTSSSTPPLLLSQRCELVMIANRMILKLYLPFLRDINGHGPNKPSHQAVLGTINAAHSIIHAARMLHSACQETRPAMFDFYDFGRALFDAAVVCAHVVIQQPTSILAVEAMKCVDSAVDVIREWGSLKHATSESGSEALRIIELMKRKADIARGAGDDAASTAGSKRKRAELEEDTFEGGFQLPFVGASVTSVQTDQSKSLLIPSKPSIPTSKDGMTKSAKEKEKERGGRYPTFGVRNRPGQGRPSNRQRTESVPPIVLDGIPPPPITNNAVDPQLIARHSHSQQQQQQQQQTSAPGIETRMSSLSFQPTHTPPGQAQILQQGSFPPAFAGHEEPQFVQDQRRYSHTSSTHSPSSAFDTHHSTSSPSGYSPTSQSVHYHSQPHSNNDGYYMHYPVPSGISPVYNGPSQGVPHPQDMPMSNYGSHAPPSSTMESSVPSTPCDAPYGIPHERHTNNTPYAQYMQKSDLTPPQHLSPEYQHPTGHSMQLSGTPIGVNGWVHAGPNTTEIWPHAKYGHV